MKCFLRLNDLFSQGSRQGTLMPGLLNYLYEQLSYHKILPFVCNLSTHISLRRTILVKYVRYSSLRRPEIFMTADELWRRSRVGPSCLCDNFRRIYVRLQSLLCKTETGITRTSRASIRQRTGKKNLRKRLATSVGTVDGTLQDVIERISSEPGTQAGSGRHRAAHGSVFLWGGFRAPR